MTKCNRCGETSRYDWYADNTCHECRNLSHEEAVREDILSYLQCLECCPESFRHENDLLEAVDRVAFLIYSEPSATYENLFPSR